MGVGSEIELRGKVALVTGSAKRVGKAVALELARQGMHQIIHHRDSAREAQETAAEVRSLGVEAIVLQADQRKPTEIAGLFDAIRGSVGRLDVLVNSASIFSHGTILEVTPEEWQRTLDINLTGPFLFSQQAARLMLEQDGGSIINILDLGAVHPWASRPHHSVSKAGLKMLTEVLAVGLGPKIRVNAVMPGFILRDEQTDPQKWERLVQRAPLGREGDPADVARAVVFLASQPFITGVTLPVDGGDTLV